jgi:hypothetical protein
MMDRLDLLLWFAAPALLAERSDAFADLVRDGMLTVQNDAKSDTVTGLAATPAGRAKIGYVMPATTD